MYTRNLQRKSRSSRKSDAVDFSDSFQMEVLVFGQKEAKVNCGFNL